MDRHNQLETGRRAEGNRNWQYSLFGLLVVTTIVSICLAFGVSFPRIAIAAVAVGLVQAAVLYLADWLIRSRGGGLLKRVAAFMWAVLGTALFFITTAIVNIPPPNDNRPLPIVLACSIGAIGLLCWIVAWRRWR